MTFPDLSALPPVTERRGTAPDTYADELRSVIEAAITNAPRSQQTAIGPSEIGHPCDRRLGYRLLGTDKVNDTPGWRPTVGTAVHDWLASTFTEANAAWREQTGQTGTRWLVEHRVDVGDDITGSCDLYDRVTRTLIDWKIVAATTLRTAKGDGPSDQYRTQVHLYGRGWTRRGLDVDTVGIFYLPSTGELHESHLWTETYDEDVATAALARLEQTRTLTAAFSDKALAALTTNTPERMCRFCPWHLPASTNLAAACPGPDRTTATPGGVTTPPERTQP